MVNNQPALPLLVPVPVTPSSMAVLVKTDEAAEGPEYSAAELKRISRDKIIFEERSKGATIPEICEKLREKGYPTGQRWIWEILHGDKAVQFVEELERVQLRDIALLRAYALKDKDNPDLKALAAAINARGMMLRNWQPNDKVNVEVNVNQQTIVKHHNVLLEEYACIIQQAAEINRNIPAVCTRESVDSEASSSGDGDKRADRKASAFSVSTRTA